MKKLTLLFAIAASLAWSQTTINGGRTVLGAWDASGATTTKPVKTGTADPASCAVGELFYRTDTGTLKHCSALNTWTDVGGSYTLPTASATVLGGVKVGPNLSIDGSGVLSSTASGGTCDPFDLNLFCLAEDFVTGGVSSGTVGKNGMMWTAISSGTFQNYNVTTAGADYNHPGLGRILSTTTAGSGGSVMVANSQTTANLNLYNWLNNEWEIRWIARLEATADARIRIGMTPTVNALVPAAGSLSMIFRYDTDAAFSDQTKNTVGSWVAQFCGYSSGTCADAAGLQKVLNITPDTNWHLFSIRRSGTTFYWKMDNTDVATMCASGCDFTTPTISNPQSISSTPAPGVVAGVSGTTQRGFLLDYVSVKITGNYTRY